MAQTDPFMWSLIVIVHYPPLHLNFALRNEPLRLPNVATQMSCLRRACYFARGACTRSSDEWRAAAALDRLCREKKERTTFARFGGFCGERSGSPSRRGQHCAIRL